MAEPRADLHAALAAFARAPKAQDFDALARRVVAYQAEALPTYGRLVASRGGLPARWQDAPLVPTDLFRDLDLCSAPGAETVFRTSGTTAGVRGARRVPDLSLYHAAMEAPFVAHVLAGVRTPRPWLALVPHPEDAPDSSLSHMTGALAACLASEVRWAMTPDGLDLPACRALLTGAREPVVVMTTSFALLGLLDALDAPLPLPAGSRMMLTGGFKGRTRELSEAELLAEVEAKLALPAAAVVPEYGMTELTSQAYGRPLVANPSLRLRVVDPVTLTDVEPGATGLVACFDLLNLDNVSAILTADLGSLDAAGRLTLHGRAPDAVARGCSLTAEELLDRAQ